MLADDNVDDAQRANDNAGAGGASMDMKMKR